MRKKYTLCSFLFLIHFFGQSQSPEKLCVCFNQGNKFIDINIQDKDSTFTHFKIIREGFETEEQRKIVMEEYRRNLFDLPPNFYMTFFAVKKPEKIYSIDEINCVDIVSLNEYRKNNYRRPVGTSSSLFIFIQKITDEKFLKWNVLMEAIE